MTKHQRIFVPILGWKEAFKSVLLNLISLYKIIFFLLLGSLVVQAQEVPNFQIITKTISMEAASQTEDFTMWGIIQRYPSPWERLIHIILAFMALYLIACSIDRFLVLKKLRKEFHEKIKAIIMKKTM